VTARWIAFGLGAAIGSVPFAWLVHRLVTGGDLREEGSGNPGATNLHRVIGPAWGAVGLVLDAGKGAAAAWLGARWAGPEGSILAALGAVGGHVVSPWLKGRGGKGVAPAAGAFAVIAPAATAAAAATFVIVVALTRWVSLGSALAAIVLPLAVAWFGPGGAAVAAAALTGLLIAWRHRANFERMRAGTEPRLSWRAGSGRSERS
jgi:acyl phosphate:glycerol-3-phosphate acyltransferase